MHKSLVFYLMWPVLFTWTNTVKKTTVMMAVRNMFFLVKCSGDSRYTRENAIAPRRPPYATMNWSLQVSFTIRNLLMIKVKPITPVNKMRHTQSLKI